MMSRKAMVSTLLAPLVLSALGATAVAQAQEQTRDSSYTVQLNQDAFFGFYPSFTGLLEVKENVDFAFYGILWTKPAFGLGQGNSGDDLWTEFGVGANILTLDGKLLVKPLIGLTNGSLLSGGDINPNRGGPPGSTRVTGSNFADGLVPSLTLNYASEKIEAELYLGYYMALRNRNDSGLDFLHYWANAGYRFSPYVSAGLHWEHLRNSRNSYPGGATADVYRWVGPYVQFSLPKGFFARFSGGTDLEDDFDGDFYKLNVGMTF